MRGSAGMEEKQLKIDSRGTFRLIDIQDLHVDSVEIEQPPFGADLELVGYEGQ